MAKLAESLGITWLSRSQVSQMARGLDEQVGAFRNRPLDAGLYTFLWLDAITLKVHRGGRTVLANAPIAVAVTADGLREVLDIASAEDGAGWVAFLRTLVARGLTGVALVTTDVDAGLVVAIGAACPERRGNGAAPITRNLSAKVPRSAQP